MDQQPPQESVTEGVQESQQVSPEHVNSSALADKKNANLVIVVVLAVIVVVLALMYLWGSATSELPPAPPVVDDTIMANDDVAVLEEDLAMPELDTLDAEMDTLEADLDKELQAL